MYVGFIHLKIISIVAQFKLKHPFWLVSFETTKKINFISKINFVNGLC